MNQEWMLLVFAVIAGLLVLICYLYYSRKFEKWKTDYTKKIREDSIKKSSATITGKVSEQLIPFFPEFKYNPKDARFIGSPIDMIVFDGLDSGELRNIVFVEVKTGNADLDKRERQVKAAIEAKQIQWEMIKIKLKS